MAIKTRHDRLPFETGIHTEKLYRGEPDAFEHHHVRSAAEQSHRG